MKMLMKAVLVYARKVLAHKGFVFYAGLKMKNHIPLVNLVFHDWTKFLPVELFNYAKKFELGHPTAFGPAWVHHMHTNKHHPEHWTYIDHTGTIVAIDMPEMYVNEWVADLFAASRSYSITKSWDIQGWLVNNVHRWDNCTTWVTKARFRDALKANGINMEIISQEAFDSKGNTYPKFTFFASGYLPHPEGKTWWWAR